MRKYFITFVFVAFSSLISFAQTGTLKGKVTDAMTGETIPMANIVVKSDGVVVIGGASDFDGNFTIKPINPGSYNVEVSFIGYQTIIQTGVLISPDKITFSNYDLSVQSDLLSEVEIIEYDVPLIDADKSGSTKTKEQITALPTRNVQNVAATTAGVYQQDTGGSLNVRGSRSNATSYYIDGYIFTGDTLFIGGTGRTDFQGGSSSDTYDSITQKIFKLPDETIVYPGHNYNGFTCSTIKEEKKSNPNVGLHVSKEDFIESELKKERPYPKRFDVAVPANMNCGKTE